MEDSKRELEDITPLMKSDDYTSILKSVEDFIKLNPSQSQDLEEKLNFFVFNRPPRRKVLDSELLDIYYETLSEEEIIFMRDLKFDSEDTTIKDYFFLEKEGYTKKSDIPETIKNLHPTELIKIINWVKQ